MSHLISRRHLPNTYTHKFICKVKQGTNKCQTFFLSLYKLQLSGTLNTVIHPNMWRRKECQRVALTVCGRQEVSQQSQYFLILHIRRVIIFI